MTALVTAAVDVWLVDLTRGEPADETLPVAQRRSARTRAALAARLGVSATALARTADGKPYLPGSSRRFSVAHCHALGVVALADGVEVGVDVEALGGPRRRRVLPGVLAAGERARVEQAADPVTEFLRCWTRKEALLKGLGCGLRVDLEEVAIDPAGPGRFAPSALPGGLGDPGAWTVVDLDLDGYAGAVAAAAGAISVTLRRAEHGEAVVARHLVVGGRVQGVFFRAFVQDAAQRAGVAGWARNEPDGSVAVRLEGPADAVSRVEAACGEGPPRAAVERVDGRDAAPEGLAGFDVG